MLLVLSCYKAGALLICITHVTDNAFKQLLQPRFFRNNAFVSSGGIKRLEMKAKCLSDAQDIYTNRVNSK